MSTIKARKNINSSQAVKRLLTAAASRDTEKEVEDTVLDAMMRWFTKDNPDTTVVSNRDRNTDGYITIHAQRGLFDSHNAAIGEKRILLEAKRDKNFSNNREDLLGVVAQACCYLREFYLELGERAPSFRVVVNHL